MEVISKRVQLIIQMAYSGRITPKSVKREPVTKDARPVGISIGQAASVDQHQHWIVSFSGSASESQHQWISASIGVRISKGVFQQLQSPMKKSSKRKNWEELFSLSRSLCMLQVILAFPFSIVLTIGDGKLARQILLCGEKKFQIVITNSVKVTSYIHENIFGIQNNNSVVLDIAKLSKEAREHWKLTHLARCKRRTPCLPLLLVLL